MFIVAENTWSVNISKVMRGILQSLLFDSQK